MKRRYSAVWVLVLCVALAPAVRAQRSAEPDRDATDQQAAVDQKIPADKDGQRPVVEYGRDEDSAKFQHDREEAFRAGRKSPDAEPAAAHLERAHQQRQIMRALQAAQGTDVLVQGANLAAGSVQWQNLGPSPEISDAYGSGYQDYGFVTGRMTSVAVDPTDASGNTVYVGGAYGGVWKSTNAANPTKASVTWTPLLDTVAPTLAVGAIAVKPDNGSVILVGTGEPNNAGDSYYGLGILRSADGGSTWTTISAADGGSKSFKGLGFSYIVFHPTQTNFVVAGAGFAAQQLGSYNSTTRGIYYSTDAGATWNSGHLTDDGVNFFVDSVQSIVYNPNNGKWFAAVKYHGFYTSSDGILWTRLPVANQPGGALLSTTTCPTTPSASCPHYRGTLAIRTDTNEMFAYFVDGNLNDQGVYRSADGGNTWFNIGTTAFDNCGDSGGCGSSQSFYNIYLGAVPNGATTDLYLGSVNLFKCPVNSTTGACSGWLNLSHVYGCSPLSVTSHLHPDQHGIDFVKTANHVTSIVYFANDGGIYRTLNSPGFSNGACTGSANPVDNLNGTMGSITQLVGFSQHPSNASILLEGSQDNGTAAVTSSGAGLTWTAVQGGDGGINLIDPVNPANWYASFPYGEITRCASGPNCRGGFSTVVDPSVQLGNDATPFYTTFMLDPANTSQMLVGTCRVWRGTPNGGIGWSAISPNFYTGNTTSTCIGGDNIKALAAGGPTSGGLSQVVYAGTVWGELWATTNAAGGAGTWVNRIPPGIVASNGTDIPISSIAIDTTDPTGQTAYATVMGFGVPHVYRTTNAFLTMTDISADLPNAPADSLAIDPKNHSIIYVGTDAGVYMTNVSVNPISWTEWGVTTGAGALPNVPVTKLEVFNGSTPKLRASTYGRGVWQVDLATSGNSLNPPVDPRHRNTRPPRKASPQPAAAAPASTTSLPAVRTSVKSVDSAHRLTSSTRSAVTPANAAPRVVANTTSPNLSLPAKATDSRHRSKRVRKLAPAPVTTTSEEVTR